ncbi:MAG: hypothetical protein DYG89_32265 [Caldilinea sp. CFX5]|nr:hypothetical protein [Caldilinea sp. CFX5]
MLIETIRFKIAWIALTLIGVAIFIFGVIVTLWPGAQDALSLRTIGVASIGMGLFGTLISVIPYRRRERWAWFALWYYPLFWLLHLLGNLPPGQDHVHQIVFILLSLLSLLLSLGEFFPFGSDRRSIHRS